MSHHWERAPAAPEMSGALFMDAELKPHRSLSAAGFRLLFAVFVLMNLGVAAYMIAHGAFPVLPFLGLDVLALWLAFRVSYQQGRRTEYIRVGRQQVHVASIDWRGRATHWVINPLWTRVVREGPGVVLRARADQMRVGAFLSPREWESLAVALDNALWRAKRGS